MEDTLKKEILALLAREWEHTGPPGILDIRDLVSIMGGSPGDVMVTVKELFARGLVDMNSLKTSVFLTPEGYGAHEAGAGEP
ncbi:MAG: hypothetical protein MI747_01650 [Desulfobacterales bacterium]|nr:hypothetical protein [Desulfobacterales bacterium]